MIKELYGYLNLYFTERQQRKVIYLTGVGFAVFTVFSCTFIWDDGTNSLKGLFRYSKIFPSLEEAMLSHFWSNFYVFWGFLILVFFLLMIELQYTFSISETLWLKLNNTSCFSIALYRVCCIIIFSILVFALSLIWICLLSVINGLWNIRMFLPPLYACTTLILLTGSLLFISTLTDGNNFDKKLIPIVILFGLVALSYLRDELDSGVGKFLPYVFPTQIFDLRRATSMIYLNNLIFGISGLLFHVFYNYFSMKNKPNQV